jgi:xanthine dehydrogenase accessory factor
MRLPRLNPNLPACEVNMTMQSRDILAQVAALKAEGTPFALATVVRTVAVTAAKAGAKAVIRADGTIAEGWIGGGCARGAVLRAARDALADGQPRLISVSPEDVLADQGVAPGDERDGVRYARSMCPSRGTMDIFVEPVIPRPMLVICGASPVAVALATLAPLHDFAVTACAPEADLPLFDDVRGIAGYVLPEWQVAPYVVVATQGKGDEAALRAALGVPSAYVAFVGSRKKMAALRAKLADVPPERLEAVRAPAGLDLGAITPAEIALSIMAEMLCHRRKGQRQAPAKAQP